MNFFGVIVGAAAFIIIGIFHPIVVKAEYYIGARIWPVFLIIGLSSIGLTLFIENFIIASILGILGFACLWSIREIFEQVERVKKGWFPENPQKYK
jgi:hypothetical protein